MASLVPTVFCRNIKRGEGVLQGGYYEVADQMADKTAHILFKYLKYMNFIRISFFKYDYEVKYLKKSKAHKQLIILKLALYMQPPLIIFKYNLVQSF